MLYQTTMGLPSYKQGTRGLLILECVEVNLGARSDRE
jgi:hypothetical protein